MNIGHAVPGWQRNLYVLAFAQFLSALGFSFVQPFLPLFVQDLGVQDPNLAAFWTGVAQFAGGVCAFVVGPIWGILADRYGRKPMVLRSMFAGAAILGLTGFAPSVEFIVLFRGLMGAFTGVVAASSALAASQAPRQRLVYAVGVIQMAFFLGNMGGPLVGGVLADAFGYRVPFFITAGVVLVGALTVLFYVKEQFQPATEQGKKASPIQNIRNVLGVPHLLPILVVLLFAQFGLTMLHPILPVFMQSMVPERAATMSGLAFALLGLVSAIAAMLVGRVGQKETLAKVLVASSFVAAFFYLPQFWVYSPLLALLFFGLLGIPKGGLVTATNSLLSASVSRGEQGALFGVVQSANAVAFGAGPLVGGTLGMALGLRSVFVVDAALFFLVGVAAWRMLGKGEATTARMDAGKTAPEPVKQAPDRG
ncbi:MAG: MFS transporter [Chloroflexi bacterium]|nr:MFS transporter [Chloroflexota bacterium]